MALAPWKMWLARPLVAGRMLQRRLVSSAVSRRSMECSTVGLLPWFTASRANESSVVSELGWCWFGPSVGSNPRCGLFPAFALLEWLRVFKNSQSAQAANFRLAA